MEKDSKNTINIEQISSPSQINADNDSQNNKPENWREFTENTTLHGARFVSQKNVLRKLFWIACLIGASAYCMKHLIKSVQYFYLRPYSTKITTIHAKDMAFPAVTICNLNILHKERYELRVKKLYRNITTKEIQLDVEQMSIYYHDLATVMQGGKSENKHNLQTRVRLARLTNEPLQTSHRLEDMFLPKKLFPCQWSARRCEIEDFKVFSALRFGQCSTFKPSSPRVKITGYADGLRMRLNVESEMYIENSYTPVVGLSVLVHSLDEYPMVEKYGFMLQTGIHASCAVRLKKILSLPSPYETDCGSKELKILKKTGYPYSRLACIKECFIDHVTTKCKCRSFDMNVNFTTCVTDEHIDCFNIINANLSTSDSFLACQKDCKESCEQDVYETKVSTANLNAKTMAIDITKFCIEDTNNTAICRATKNLTKIEKIQYIRDNIITLDVYLESLYFDQIKQVPVLEWFTLLSNIGGNLGLFLGMSVLTITEFFEYCFRILWYKLRMTGSNRIANSEQ